MKITTVLGSPRINGNSATIARSLRDMLTGNGAKDVTFGLNNLLYRGCQACMACKTTSEKCIVKDDLETVLDDIWTSDVTIIASPVFCMEISAQTKGLIDRLYSFLKIDFRTNPEPSRLPIGKKLVFILSQGNPDGSMFGDIIARYSRMFGRLGFTSVFPIRALGVGPGSDVLKNESIVRVIRETAEKLISGHIVNQGN